MLLALQHKTNDLTKAKSLNVPVQLVYLKAVVVLLVIWRILTIGIFGQVVGGVLSATLAYCLSRRSNAVPQQVSSSMHEQPITPQALLTRYTCLSCMSRWTALWEPAI